MYEIIYSKVAEKQLNKFDKQIQKRLLKTIDRIRVRPLDYCSILVGMNLYKFRVGMYRFILDIQNQKLVILVLEIDKRDKIYKK